MRKTRDSQRSKVYAWERAIPGYQEGKWEAVPVRKYCLPDGSTSVFSTRRCRIADEMSLDDCTALITKVWKAYHPAARYVPKVTPGHLARRATGSRERISLPRWSRQSTIVLHETAHSLQPPIRWVEADAPDEHLVAVAWHGPEFMRLFIELLVRYHAPARGMRGELLRSARAARIKVGSLQDCLKPPRRARSV